MLMFTLASSHLTFQFTLIHGPNIPGSYAILFFTALATWWEEPTHWKRPDAGKDWKQEEKRTTEDEMVGRRCHQLNAHEFERAPGDSKGQGRLACCSPWGRKELDETELNWTECEYIYPKLLIYPSLPFLAGNHKFVFFPLYFIIFCWSIVDFQYYISFRCTA